ncbi:hypothetical protein F5Y15DRAFT_418047 [Xylariaceae sp. FL0016]|nr:hypothetical protein F5Y15DRAFT_418047 [Xylariaceae sp. FL0016]
MFDSSEAESLIRAPADQEQHHRKGLSQDSQDVYEISPSISRRLRIKSRQRHLMPVIHVVLITLYTSVFLFFQIGVRPGCHSPENIVKSPASSIIQYHPKVFDSRLHIESPYTGDPTPEIDQAWADLVEDMHVRVSGDDLRAIGKTSIALPDEDGTFWGTLGVNHEIHCIKRLREALYEEYYFPNLTSQEREMNLLHSAHCIEILRQAAQCRGDTSIVTMYWGDADATPVADFDSPHACVDWEALVDWQKERRFDPKKPGLLRHPLFGLAYPDGKGSKLGVNTKGSRLQLESAES